MRRDYLIAVVDKIAMRLVPTKDFVFSKGRRGSDRSHSLRNYVDLSMCGSSSPSLGVVDLVASRPFQINSSGELSEGSSTGDFRAAISGARYIWKTVMGRPLGWFPEEEMSFVQMITQNRSPVSLNTRMDYYNGCDQARRLGVHPDMCDPYYFFRDVTIDPNEGPVNVMCAPCLLVTPKQAWQVLEPVLREQFGDRLDTLDDASRLEVITRALPESLALKPRDNVPCAAFSTLFSLPYTATHSAGVFLTSNQYVEYLRVPDLAVRAMGLSQASAGMLAGAMYESSIMALRDVSVATTDVIPGHVMATENIRQRKRWSMMVGRTLHRLRLALRKFQGASDTVDDVMFSMSDLSPMLVTHRSLGPWVTNSHVRGLITMPDAVALSAVAEAMGGVDPHQFAQFDYRTVLRQRRTARACRQNIHSAHQNLISFAKGCSVAGVGPTSCNYIREFTQRFGRKVEEPFLVQGHVVTLAADESIFVAGQNAPLTGDLCPWAELVGSFIEETRSVVRMEEVLDMPLHILLATFTGQMNLDSAAHCFMAGDTTCGKTLAAEVLETVFGSDIVARVTGQSDKALVTGDDRHFKGTLFYNEPNVEQMGAGIGGKGNSSNVAGSALTIMLNALESSHFTYSVNTGTRKDDDRLHVRRTDTNSMFAVVIASNIMFRSVAPALMRRFCSPRYLPKRARNYTGLASATAIASTPCYHLMRSVLFHLRIVEDLVSIGALPSVATYPATGVLNRVTNKHNDSLNRVVIPDETPAPPPGDGTHPASSSGSSESSSTQYDAMYSPRQLSVMRNGVLSALTYVRLIMLNTVWLKTFWASNPQFTHADLCTIVSLHAVSTPGDAIGALNSASGLDSFRGATTDEPISQMIQYDLVTTFLLALWSCAYLCHSHSMGPAVELNTRTIREQGEATSISVQQLVEHAVRGDTKFIEKLLKWPKQAFSERCYLWLVVAAARWAARMGPLLTVTAGRMTASPTHAQSAGSSRARPLENLERYFGGPARRSTTKAAPVAAPTPPANALSPAQMDTEFLRLMYSEGVRNALLELQEIQENVQRIANAGGPSYITAASVFLKGEVVSQPATEPEPGMDMDVDMEAMDNEDTHTRPAAANAMASANWLAVWEDIMNRLWSGVRRQEGRPLHVVYSTADARRSGVRTLWDIFSPHLRILHEMRMSPQNLKRYTSLLDDEKSARHLPNEFLPHAARGGQSNLRDYAERHGSMMRVMDSLCVHRGVANWYRPVSGMESDEDSEPINFAAFAPEADAKSTLAGADQPGSQPRGVPVEDPAMQRSRWAREVEQARDRSAKVKTTDVKRVVAVIQCLMRGAKNTVTSATRTAHSLLRMSNARVYTVDNTRPELGGLVFLDMAQMRDVSTSPVVGAAWQALKQYTEDVAQGDTTPVSALPEKVLLAPLHNDHLNALEIHPPADAKVAERTFTSTIDPCQEPNNAMRLSRLLSTGSARSSNGADTTTGAMSHCNRIVHKGTLVDFAHRCRRRLHIGVYSAYLDILQETVRCFLDKFYRPFVECGLRHASLEEHRDCNSCIQYARYAKGIQRDMDLVQTGAMDARAWLKRYAPWAYLKSCRKNDYPTVFIRGKASRVLHELPAEVDLDEKHSLDDLAAVAHEHAQRAEATRSHRVVVNPRDQLRMAREMDAKQQRAFESDQLARQEIGDRVMQTAREKAESRKRKKDEELEDHRRATLERERQRKKNRPGAHGSEDDADMVEYEEEDLLDEGLGYLME